MQLLSSHEQKFMNWAQTQNKKLLTFRRMHKIFLSTQLLTINLLNCLTISSMISSVYLQLQQLQAPNELMHVEKIFLYALCVCWYKRVRFAFACIVCM